MRRFAEGTEIDASRSMHEVITLLRRHGAEDVGYLGRNGYECVVFRVCNRTIRIGFPVPQRDDPQFKKSPTGRRRRNDDLAYREWEREVKRLWRSMVLVVKSKMEAIHSGVATFEQEFLPYVVLGNGRTVAEAIIPQLEAAEAKGQLPAQLALPMLGEA